MTAPASVPSRRFATLQRSMIHALQAIPQCRRLCRLDDPALRVRRDRLDGSDLQVRRHDVAQLSLRSGQRAADTRTNGRHSKPGACGWQTHRPTKAKVAVARKLAVILHRMWIEEPNSNGHQRRLPISLHNQHRVPAEQGGNQGPCRDAGVGEIAPGFAMLERAKRASHIDPPASSYAIMRRACPYRGENHEPGKDVHGKP